MIQPNTGSSEDATRQSAVAVAAVDPILTRSGKLADFIAVAPRTLFHAGPPLRAAAAACRPLLNAAATAAILEGWAATPGDALAMIAAGEIALEPAQDSGIVVPLAFVAGPSSAVLAVTDRKDSANRTLVSINDGPPAGALRFGAPKAGTVDHLRHLGDTVAPALDRVLRDTPIPLLPIAARALANGDDLHGQVAASSAEIVETLSVRIGPGPASDTIVEAAQFFLNPWMAACAVMLHAGAGVAGSTIVVAAGGNGREAGVKLGARPNRWLTFPARPPRGPRLDPSLAGRPALPAIGDSVVIDACGFGAQALSFAPDLRAAFGAAVPAALPGAPAVLLRAPHSGFAPLRIRVGLDLRVATPAAPFCATLAILDADGEVGLIGRGIAVMTDDGPALASMA